MDSRENDNRLKGGGVPQNICQRFLLTDKFDIIKKVVIVNGASSNYRKHKSPSVNSLDPNQYAVDTEVSLTGCNHSSMNGHSVNDEPSPGNNPLCTNGIHDDMVSQNGDTSTDRNQSLTNGIHDQNKIETSVDECNNAHIVTSDTTSDTNSTVKSDMHDVSSLKSDVNSMCNNVKSDTNSVQRVKSDINSPSTVKTDKNSAPNMTNPTMHVKPPTNGHSGHNGNAGNGFKRICYGSRGKNGRVLCLKMADITGNRPKLRRYMLEVGDTSANWGANNEIIHLFVMSDFHQVPCVSRR